MTNTEEKEIIKDPVGDVAERLIPEIDKIAKEMGFSDYRVLDLLARLSAYYMKMAAHDEGSSYKTQEVMNDYHICCDSYMLILERLNELRENGIPHYAKSVTIHPEQPNSAKPHLRYNKSERNQDPIS